MDPLAVNDVRGDSSGSVDDVCFRPALLGGSSGAEVDDAIEAGDGELIVASSR